MRVMHTNDAGMISRHIGAIGKRLKTEQHRVTVIDNYDKPKQT